MRWQTAMMAALVLAACETNDATELVDVTADDLAGTYELLTIGGTPPAGLDVEYCVDSSLDMFDSGDFEISHHFTERNGIGLERPCSTDPDRIEFDVFWRGEFENTSTLVVMSILESEFLLTNAGTTISEVAEQHTELVGEYNPDSGRLVVAFPSIWSFDPHGGSGGKISVGGDVRGLGGGTLVFDR